MFTIPFKFSAPALLPPTPSAQERLGQWTGILLGTILSPSWFMLKAVLSYYLPMGTMFHNGISTATALEFIAQLEALGPSVLLGQVVPILLICQVVSLTFLYSCGCLGKGTVRILGKTRQSRTV